MSLHVYAHLDIYVYIYIYIYILRRHIYAFCPDMIYVQGLANGEPMTSEINTMMQHNRLTSGYVCARRVYEEVCLSLLWRIRHEIHEPRTLCIQYANDVWHHHHDAPSLPHQRVRVCERVCVRECVRARKCMNTLWATRHELYDSRTLYIEYTNDFWNLNHSAAPVGMCERRESVCARMHEYVVVDMSRSVWVTNSNFERTNNSWNQHHDAA